VPFVSVAMARREEVYLDWSGELPLGVQLSSVLVGVVGLVNLDAPPLKGADLVGDPVGVEYRRGEGDTGDSGRRNGELRVGDEPYPR